MCYQLLCLLDVLSTALFVGCAINCFVCWMCYQLLCLLDVLSTALFVECSIALLGVLMLF